MLVVLTGLPATGKSTLARAVARALPAAYLSVDPIQAAIDQTPVIEDPLGKISYEVVRRIADLQIGLGLSAVVDAVNPFEWIRAGYRDMAHGHGADHALIFLAFSDLDAHRARVEARAARGPAIGWGDVEKQIAYYEAPSELTLRLDAAEAVDENARLALEALARIGC